MKPPRFEYAAPTTVAEAVSLLQQHESEAKILAGGQSLMPLLNMRLTRPGLLIDLGRVAELRYLRETDGGLAIGAMTTKRTVEDSAMVKSRQPLLHAATLLIGHAQIRNRGTVGGSLAHADPAAEYPALAVAVDAQLRVVGPKGERTIAAAEFYVSYLTTALEPTEILTEVRFPALANDTGWSCAEVARRHGDFAMTGAVVTVRLGSDGRCAQSRIVLFGVGPTPLRALAAEQVVIGQKPSEKLFAQAGQRVSEAIEEPLSDVHASAEYRRYLAQVLTRRALAEAAARARGAA
ncbi:MAG TPA: xanthine dehydrogenase family protein subunit M [Candidatus Binatia bacterium]